MKKIIKPEELDKIIGQTTVKKQLISSVLVNHNVLIVGPPGTGKTTIAQNLSKVIDKEKKNFVRIQGSPDLTVEDIFGDIDPEKALKHGVMDVKAFVPGKIFKAKDGVLFFDEINRAPEKLQNALLQVLSEKKINLGAYDVDFDVDFVFIATMNPHDSSTEKLSDVLLDRFDVIYMNYPEKKEDENKILDVSAKQIVKVSERIKNIIVNYIHKLRDDDNLTKHPGVRATISWYELSQSIAKMKEKKTVTDEDVKEALGNIISHRIELKPSLKYKTSPLQYINKNFTEYMQRQDEEEGDLP